MYFEERLEFARRARIDPRISKALTTGSIDMRVVAIVVDVDMGRCSAGSTVHLLRQLPTDEDLAGSGWEHHIAKSVHLCVVDNPRDWARVAKGLWPEILCYDAHCTCCVTGDLELIRVAS